jgi:ribosomal-protein-alanine N-acetyltransferase
VLADADQVQQRFPRWEIVRYMAATIPWPYPDDGALSYIRDLALPAIAAGEQHHWSSRLKAEPDALIGMISLMLQPDDHRGFWLDPAWQGQGLMTEACEAATDFWFDELGQPVLRVPKAIANAPSRAISARSGMRVIWTGERDYVGGRGAAELWEISAGEWRAR